MTNPRIKLKKLIRSLLEEVISEECDECGCGMPECSTCHPTDDVTEMNVTANIDGYQTPFAFDDDDEEGMADEQEMKDALNDDDSEESESDSDVKEKKNESRSRKV